MLLGCIGKYKINVHVLYFPLECSGVKLPTSEWSSSSKAPQILEVQYLRTCI